MGAWPAELAGSRRDLSAIVLNREYAARQFGVRDQRRDQAGSQGAKYGITDLLNQNLVEGGNIAYEGLPGQSKTLT